MTYEATFTGADALYQAVKRAAPGQPCHYSRLCMVCQVRPGTGEWPLCKMHEPESWVRHVLRWLRRAW